MKNFRSIFLKAYLISYIFIGYSSFAQIGIAPGPGVTPEDMVENIVGEGIEYSNVTFQGADASRGIFTNGGSTNLGIESGIFLTSGAGYIIPGPNTQSGAGADNGLGGHPLLTGITSGTTYDAAVLEFDFVPESDTLRFKYVFGSDEYNEFVFSVYNDVFGYFVTGPNPAGGYYADENIALIPGTQVSVTINNVNNGHSNPGVVPTGPCNYCEYYSDNTGGLTLEYDGFTTVLTAILRVVPCQTYHIAMGVADVGDHVWDAGVFIEENSFESPKIVVETDPYPEGVSDNMIEGCVEADIIFKLPKADYAPITIYFDLSGSTCDPSAYPPGDFEEEIPNFVTFEDGEDSVAIHVIPVKDDIIEGEEILQIIVENTLGCEVRYDTVEFTILDYVDMETETSPDTYICQGQEIEVWVNTINGIPEYSFEWEELPYTNDTITVSPDTSTMYYVNVMDLCMDTVSDSIHVTVFPLPEVDIGNDSAILCDGDTLLLNAGSGYLAYLWQDTSTDSTFIVTEPGLYYVIVSGPGGCTTSDSVFVELTEMAIELGVDTTICIGDTITFYAGEGFSSYLWQDGSTNSTYTAYETGWYWVDVVLDGCSVTDSVYLYVDDPDVSVELGDDIIICSGDVIVLQPQSGVFNSYTWSTGDTTSSIMVSLPGTYILEVEGGCGESSDTITIGNYPPVNINLGPDLTLCFGESEMLNPSGFNSYLWQDNSTQPFFIVNQSGMYYVDVTDNHGCIGSDTVYAQVGSIVDLGPDTILCEGKTITLDAGYEFDFYNWNTGQSGVQSIEVTEGGTYSVEVNYYFGCTSEDEIYIEGVPLPVAVISGNDNLCEGETIWLNALPGSYEYYWNGNTTPDSASIEVTQGGTYVLRTENVCGDTTTEKTIQEYPLPEPNLGDDLTLFPGDYINLNPGQFNSYLWQDNSENPTYPVSYEDLAVEDSIFFVEVFDGFCFNKDEIIIRIFNVEVPNVITPNGDNKNDIFKPINFVGVNNHNIMIFNRWGNKVWESNNFNDGWDGKENGKYVAEGTYFWVLEVYYGTDNVKKAYKGSVTVLGTGGS